MNRLRFLCVAFVLLVLVACKPSETASSQTTGTGAAAAGAPSIQINGAGATFPYPIYSKWFEAYGKGHPEARINYQSIGSGGGIKQLTAGTVFFGATDGPMTDEQLKSAPGPILHFPTVLGAVVPIYEVPDVTAQLHFTGPLLADIYLGKINKWNDPAIAKANPDVRLPATDIAVVHRSDGSGTTYICNLLVHLAAPLPERAGQATREDHGRLPEVGADGRAEARLGAPLRAAAAVGGRQGNAGAGQGAGAVMSESSGGQTLRPVLALSPVRHAA